MNVDAIKPVVLPYYPPRKNEKTWAKKGFVFTVGRKAITLAARKK